MPVSWPDCVSAARGWLVHAATKRSTAISPREPGSRSKFRPRAPVFQPSHLWLGRMTLRTQRPEEAGRS